MAEGSLNFVTVVDNKQAISALNQMRQEFSRMAQQAQETGGSMDDVFRGLKGTIAGVASIATLKQLTSSIEPPVSCACCAMRENSCRI